MFNVQQASPSISSSSSDLNDDFSFESSSAHTSAMSRQSSALSFQTDISSESYDFSDCRFDDGLIVETNGYYEYTPASTLQPSWTEQTTGVNSWMQQLNTVNPLDVMNTLPSESLSLPYQDFELFPQSSCSSQEPPLFSIPQPIPYIPDTTAPESAAVTAAGRSLYVDKATSTHNDLPEVPRKTPSISKRQASRPSPQSPSPGKVGKRHTCRMPSCGKSFVRRSDVLRHQADVHNLAAESYRCEAISCTYHTKRSDKMKEHCQKMHGHRKGGETFAVVQR